jgi:hypothetical protein
MKATKEVSALVSVKLHRKSKQKFHSVYYILNDFCRDLRLELSKGSHQSHAML